MRKAKSMQKRVERLKEEQAFVSRGSPWRLRLQGLPLEADRLQVFEGLQVRAAPGLPTLFEADELSLRSGDKVALLGANGAGKSSLLRQCWRDWLQGEAGAGWRPHPAARIAYYDQSLRRLDDAATLPDALYPFAPLSDAERRQALISAGFAYTRGQTVATLSGGGSAHGCCSWRCRWPATICCGWTSRPTILIWMASASWPRSWRVLPAVSSWCRTTAS
ncbi:ATP-binding cassette domain-containing protein [Chromobacterium haemolyticum]|nr:ATP-binding cassette domain-containing protein [Chromobacterium haemolyticum]